MEINKNIKEELERRIKAVEDFIAEKGIGSSKLTKARKTQRSVNLAVFLGSLVTVAGFLVWLLNSEKD